MLLYYITDRRQFPGGDAAQRQRLLECIASCAQAGVDLIQLREKDLPPRELEAFAVEAKSAVAGTAARLLMNRRIDVAIAAGLGGVHLTSSADELVPSDARVAFDRAGIHRPLIGISCHTEKEILLADSHGADLAVFGPVFEKDGAANAAGLEQLRALRGKVSMKILALGGVTVDNARSCLEAGTTGVAGTRLFQKEKRSLLETVRRLKGL